MESHVIPKQDGCQKRWFCEAGTVSQGADAAAGFRKCTLIVRVLDVMDDVRDINQ